jgi:REP element-mobilizing transposase RayT
MKPQRIYSGQNLNPAFCLRYSWTGWPSGTSFRGLPDDQILESVRESWQTDGLRLLEWNWSAKTIQLTFSTTPEVSPVFLATRAKGRLQHALREFGTPQKFSRKLSVRSIGDNATAQVENYITNQVKNESFVDPVFANKMQDLILVDRSVSLSAPSPSGRAMYWYNLHLVLVVVERARIADLDRLKRIRDGCSRIASKKGYRISTLSVMLDHLHIGLRGDHRQSPLEIALGFQNNLAYLLGQALWAENFYIGTFSEYSMRAVRRARKTGLS